jgi:pyruvate,water dikinase
MQKPGLQAALREGQLPDDPEFRQAWALYLKKHGHRGVYESDIARPRLHEAPAAVLVSLASSPTPRQPPPRRTLLGWLTLPLWLQAGRTMRAREHLRYTAILGFDRIRQALLKLAQIQIDRGNLPNVEALWLLSIEEVRQLDQGWLPEPGFFIKRSQEIAHLESCRLPDLFHRFDDLEDYRSGVEAVATANRLRGVSLTSGEVEGRAWVLSEPQIDLPSDFTPQQTILVARSVDAGWIPTFARVAGVVVEIGGDLSHGSIILREIGLPAITNVRGVTQQVRTGDRLLLRASTGILERI